MKKLLLTLFVISFYTNILSAQETVYFKKSTSEDSKKKKRKSGEDNIVKLAPLSFIGGVIPVYFERRITDFLGVQVGVGVTTHNYLKDILSNSEFFEPDVKRTVWNDGMIDTYTNEGSLIDYDHRKAKLGSFFAIEPRIYFENEGLEGSFIGISFSRANFKSTYERVATGGMTMSGEPAFTAGSFEEQEKTSDVLAMFGTQTMYDNISLEYTGGIGLRNLSGTKYVYGRDYNGNFVDGVAEIEKTKLTFNFSIKVGYHF